MADAPNSPGGSSPMTGRPEPTRDGIFALAAAKLRQDFLGLRVVPHRGLKGDEASRLVRDFLNGHLPKRFSAGSGFILDRRDKISKQTDVVIYDAINCPVYRTSDEAAIFPADNVAAVVEVKSRLDGEKLAEAWGNIAAAKSLAKTKAPEGPFLVQSQTFGCVFAFESAISVDTLVGHYRKLLVAHGLGQHIDLVLVFDEAVLTLAAKPRGLDWSTCIFEGPGGPGAEGSHLGVAALQLGEASLDGFLRLLLAQLIFFRGIVDHPGFGSPGRQMKVWYLTSITMEQDPEKKTLKLREYRADAESEMKGNATPSSGGAA
jgi:hypothetical protein